MELRLVSSVASVPISPILAIMPLQESVNVMLLILKLQDIVCQEDKTLVPMTPQDAALELILMKITNNVLPALMAASVALIYYLRRHGPYAVSGSGAATMAVRSFAPTKPAAPNATLIDRMNTA